MSNHRMQTMTTLQAVLFGVALTIVSATPTIENGVTKKGSESCDVETAFACDDDRTECISGNRKCDGLPHCSTGRDESVRVCGCLPTEFQCNVTHCIDLVKRCDREIDCIGGLDEDNCETYECPLTHFKCANHKCVPRDKTCDFEDDCGDGSDEQMCKILPCGFGSFTCDNGECTLSTRLCDGVLNCKDGSDEMQERCDAHFLCPTGFYVSPTSVCDGWVDCHITKVDEANCGECMTTEFRCPNGQCIGQSAVCDQVCDCTGCEDERSCDVLYCPPESHYVCKTTLRCIPHHRLCDGHNDCKNTGAGMDEYFCHNDTDCSSFLPSRGQHTFQCPEGRCLPSKARCNQFGECKRGEDEQGCDFVQCSNAEFRCTNSRCVALASRCDAINDCWDWSDEIGCDNHQCPDDHTRCRSGQCLPEYKWCNYWPNCPDGSDEENCDYQECEDGEFKCLNGECIPSSLVCYNGRKMGRDGCQDRSHLIHCNDHECVTGTFKCRNSFCVDQDQLCDGNPDCFINFSDEDNCPYPCPVDNKVCTCFDAKMMCERRGLEEPPLISEHERISEFHWSGNQFKLSISSTTFNDSHYDALTSLDLSRNEIASIPVGLFLSLWRLTYLNVANNSISTLRNGSLTGLKNLRQLFLQGNQIEKLDSGVFMDLGQLPTLDLSNQNLTSLEVNTFQGLRSLMLLNLSGNQMTYLQNGVFNGISGLLTLDISRNTLVLIHQNVFYSLPSLSLLYTDEFRFCCLAEGVSECHPAGDEFSSCQDLMSNFVLRLCIWVLGLTASLGNGLVIIWRARSPRASKVHSFLITNLAVGDFVMGVYLVIIAMVDAHYRGVYSLHDDAWRSSALCHLAGFFAMFSSELSVLTLTVITLDRLCCIIFPLRIRRLGIKGAVGVMAFVWTVVFVIAFIPLSGIPSFGNFYGRSAVCLALPLTPARPPGWEYSVAVVLVLNFLSLLLIAFSYVWMFLVARKTRTAVRSRESKGDSAMARRMTMIVMTDLMCWIPIVFLGFASMTGIHPSNQVYAWIAVFILPINSAINPVLYTISTAPFIGHVTNRARCFRKSFINSLNADTKNSYVDDRTVQSLTTDRRSSPRRGETILYSVKRDHRTGKPLPRNGEEPMRLKILRVTGPEYSRGSSSDV